MVTASKGAIRAVETMNESSAPSAQKRHATSEMVAALWTGSFAVLVFGLQPLLYGAYVHIQIIDADMVGLLAAAEIAAVAIGSGLAVPALRRMPTYVLALTGIAVICFCNLVPIDERSAGFLFPIRMAAGLGSGFLVGITAVAIARTQRVGNWAAAYLFGQGASQLTLMEWFAAVQTDPTAWQIQLGLAVLTGSSALVVPFLPNLRVAQTTGQVPVSDGRGPDRAGVLCLIAMFALAGGSAAIWAYLALWLDGRGVPAATAASLLTLCLAGQALGAAATSAVREGPYDPIRVLVSVCVLLLVVALWLGTPASALLSFGFGFCWMSGLPALSSVLARVDPKRRAVPFAAAAQLSGVAVVPTVLGVSFAASLDTFVIAGCTVIATSAVIVLAMLPTIRERGRVAAI